MFSHNDHLRFSGFATPRITGAAPHQGGHARPRNTDLNAFLDKVGLSGQARKI